MNTTNKTAVEEYDIDVVAEGVWNFTEGDEPPDYYKIIEWVKEALTQAQQQGEQNVKNWNYKQHLLAVKEGEHIGENRIRHSRENNAEYYRKQGEQIGVERERERCLKIVNDENYILEEWYSSSLRPNQIDVFKVNQRNIKTRNIITKALQPTEPLVGKE